MKRKSSPRLKDFEYIGPYAYSITLSTYQNKEIFINPDAVTSVLGYLQESAQKYYFKIFSYCFMPNHLHLLIQGGEGSPLKDFMRFFKQKSEFYYRKEFNNRLWHLSYYDHVLRKEESINQVAGYILNNPVRKGLVNDFRKYPYSGSLITDVNEIESLL